MKEFHKVIRVFRKELSDFKFKVRCLKLSSKYYGLCEKKNGIFFIYLNEEMDEDMCIHILLHELAHMLNWEDNGDIHNTKWGKAYSKIYRMFLEKYIHKGN